MATINATQALSLVRRREDVAPAKAAPAELPRMLSVSMPSSICSTKDCPAGRRGSQRSRP